tara:strand:+ start:216 stop:875 length:660 start_codon:yes stop_codon:yes gene_type:complete
MKKGLIRFVILSIVGFMLGAAFAYFEVRPKQQDAASRVMEIKPVEAVKPISDMKGEFSLISEDGEAVTHANWDGKYKLVFFGFTHCPDICPAAMDKASEVLEMIGTDRSQILVPIFVTVDPARDTAEVMKEYTDGFDERIVGLTGSQDQIDAAIDTFKVYAAKAGMDEDNPHDQNDMYMMEHSSYFYLMNPNNELIKVVPSSDTVTEIADKLSSLIQPK